MLTVSKGNGICNVVQWGIGHGFADPIGGTTPRSITYMFIHYPKRVGIPWLLSSSASVNKVFSRGLVCSPPPLPLPLQLYNMQICSIAHPGGQLWNDRHGCNKTDIFWVGIPLPLHVCVLKPTPHS